MSYYNTVNLVGNRLQQAIAKANSQEEFILSLFKVYDKPMSPSEVLKGFNRVNKQVPITSIRRAMTNLTNEGKLIKTDEKREGIYGMPEHIWKLKTNNNE